MSFRTLAISLVVLGCGSSGGFPEEPGMPPGATGKDAAVAAKDSAAPGEDASDNDVVTPPQQIGNYGPKDKPEFKTPQELCAYVNAQRQGYASHDRFKGPPWSGSYHKSSTWPLTLAIDPTLMNEAQQTANKIAAGEKPLGSPYSDGNPPPHQYLWVSGVSTARYQIATQEKAGDWTAQQFTGNLTAGITPNNGTARMALFYHDSGGSGPALGKIGCGGAQVSGGASWWWVVVIAQ